MYFKRIDMHGFKSFAEPVSIDFHEGITCIVGPNGSGKSNISDAIRWVLGEQSPKMLRGGKMEEVIFAGTASRKSRGMAEVTLVLDNSKGILPIDYSEVAITRRMYRSGESEYYINNNACRLRDIRELIMDTGIGVDGYSLIGQGKISDIVSNKPESRREIFEEAAGIVKYRSKKAEAERKLESTAHNLERVDDIVAEIESRIVKLEEDSKKASEYLMLKDRYNSVEINITLKNIETIELKNEYMKDDLLETENQIDGYKDQKNAIDEDIRTNRERNDELDAQGIETRDLILAHVEGINLLTNQGLIKGEKRSAIDKDTVRLEEETRNVEAKIGKELNHTTELLAAKEKIEQDISSLSENLTTKNSLYLIKLEEFSDFAAKIEDQKNCLYALHNEVFVKTSEKSSLESLQNTLTLREQQIIQDRQIEEESIFAASKKHELYLGERTTIALTLGQLSANREQLAEKYRQGLEKERNTVQELSAAQILTGELSSRKKVIIEMENTYEGYNTAVKFIMKNAGDISGIHGVVADLISVPSGFEIAIETALGSALQNMVCEDDESAKRAISSLKNNKAGRLTFLPLKSIRPSQPNQNNEFISAIGFKGFGTECIAFDPQYSPIMSYLLGRVILVDSLENAVKLSKNSANGLRFVTLEGEVINSGGAITGGTYRNSPPNLLGRKNEVKNLTEKLLLLSVNASKFTDELASLRRDIENFTIQLSLVDKDHREAEMAGLNCSNEIERLERQLLEFEHNTLKWQKELISIDQERQSAKAMIDDLENRRQAAEVEAQKLEKHTAYCIDELEKRKKLVEGLNEEMTLQRLALGSAESESNNLSVMQRRIAVYSSELRDENKNRESSLERLRIAKVELEKDEAELSEIIKGKENERKELDLDLSQNQAERELILGYLKEVGGKKETLDQAISDFQSQKYDIDLKLAKNGAQIEGYKEKLWDEFEISYIQAIEFKKHDFVMTTAQREVKDIRTRIKELGEVNVGAIKEYEIVLERYEFLSSQRKDLLEAIHALKQIIEDMDRTIRSNFKASFDKIAANFRDTFVELFGGGSAELRLEDESRPLDSGIEIVAQPPGKKLQNINLLSGGEKTMTAIALMFAVLKAKPTPFCILDEVEAALDDSNITRFADYLRNFREIQFALVTHQKATMQYADILYGVTMPEQGISKVISLKLSNSEG